MNEAFSFNANGECENPHTDRYYTLGNEVDVCTAYSEKLQRWLAGYRFRWGDDGYASPCIENARNTHYKTQNAARCAVLDLALKEFKSRGASTAIIDKLLAARIRSSEGLYPK